MHLTAFAIQGRPLESDNIRSDTNTQNSGVRSPSISVIILRELANAIAAVPERETAAGYAADGPGVGVAGRAHNLPNGA